MRWNIKEKKLKQNKKNKANKQNVRTERPLGEPRLFTSQRAQRFIIINIIPKYTNALKRHTHTHRHTEQSCESCSTKGTAFITDKGRCSTKIKISLWIEKDYEGLSCLQVVP